MALLNLRLPSWNTDLVQIIDPEKEEQVYKSARPVKIQVIEESELMKQPRENGSVQVDHKIDLPIIINMEVVLDRREYKDVYKHLQEARVGGIKLRLQTRVSTYENMFISGMPHEETAQNFTNIAMTISFEQALIFGVNKKGLTKEKVKEPESPGILKKGVIGAKKAGAALKAAGDKLFSGYTKITAFGE
jgi:hypothetical protein